MDKSFILKIIIVITVSLLYNSVYSQDNLNSLYEKKIYSPNLNTNKAIDNFNKYDVQKYKINLELNPDNKFIDGNVSIVFESKENNLSDITINLAGLQIDSIVHTNANLNYTRQQDEVDIVLWQSLQNGQVDSIIIYYHGVPNRGMYFRTGKYGHKLIYTHSEPFDARYWFPCKDEPSDKVLLEVKITVPQDLIAASNGHLVESIILNQNQIQYYWKEDYPISSYLISLAVAEYDIVTEYFVWNLNEMPVQYFAYPEDYEGAHSSIINTIEMLEFFSDYIGEYPFMLEKYGMVEAPFLEAGAMENQTLTLMGESIADNENVIAHELAHQWWGDAVTLESFENIWLNEGFATYFEALFFEHIYGEENFKDRMIVLSSSASNDGSIDYPIYNPPMEYLFGSAVYNKGAWVLHMLRSNLGDDVFKSIMRNYYLTYAYDNASTEDFINICQNVSGQSLGKFFDQWLYYAGMPNIFAEWNQRENSVIIDLRQLQSEPIYEFNLDLKLVGINKDTIFTINLASNNQTFNITFPDPVTQLIIDPERKILNINNSPVYSIPQKSELIKLYPNPFNNKLNIFYRIDKSQNVRIEIWDIMGRKIETLKNGKERIGTYNLSYQPAGLASGVYYCILTTESNIDREKVIFLK